jgi:hypothetical protein
VSKELLVALRNRTYNLLLVPYRNKFCGLTTKDHRKNSEEYTVRTEVIGNEITSGPMFKESENAAMDIVHPDSAARNPHNSGLVQ